ncbi:AraC family transcriptional regulator with amidase-like domain [Brevibacterium sanguinis]|uniref:AraC family transcriptional regulator with amidase-like domain n=2 Tax=Brevibacterium TaxID=1696 RepID=A0A366IMA1_9MICO|nr:MULTISPECIES: helix-turn-helix domain-containing protein [Brevibacterium]RBP65689.1 AraC family transcriptional regulator with amidase-like domain [Brevibacterium sanguinis]RBP72323.1 AraC family transcriptional regulator with amidase-like domain [Brevibacterium celere]
MSLDPRASAREKSRAKPHRIVVLALAGVSAMDLGVPAQIFGEGSSPAPVVAGAGTGGRAAVPGSWPYAVEVCTPVPGVLAGAEGLDYSIDRGLDALEGAGTIVIPGSASAVAGEPSGAVIGALLSAFEAGSRLVAISTGTFVLARTGLLDGRRATTHWAHAKELAKRYPSIAVDENVLFVSGERLLTSAGAASAIDLCLHLIRHDHGVGLSNQVARRLVAAAYRSAGQAQYVPRSVPEPLGEVFADTRQWALEHIGEPLTLGDLAANAGVSVRTFSRRFVEDTGYTPMQWVLRARVDLARELLENTDLGIEQIADEVGLGTGANLRMHFQRILSTTPNEYRHNFSDRE